MDFFARQSAERRGSHLLLVLFAAALLAMGAIVHVAVVGMSVLLGESSSIAEPSSPALAMIAVVWLTALLGAFFRSLDVRAGGAALARRFGGSPVEGSPVDASERRLLDTVAEVAIAASIEPPETHVLRRESAINAFVLGGAGGRPALVVSRGALDALDRDELRGVVAHELAHVAQGDLPLNMRLLVALGGLVALDEVGIMLVGEPLEGDRRGPPFVGALLRARAHPMALVGWPLRALGSVGVLAAGLIRAAVSRRREYLADATAAQFTRQPSALASALATIRDAADPRPLHAAHLQEIAHLCFHDGARPPWYRRLLASHPPLQSRIDALDPHVDVKRRKRSGRERAAGGGASVATNASGNGIPTSSLVASTVGEIHPDAAVRTAVPTALSERLQLVLADGSDCLAALCALFAPDDPPRRRDHLDAIAAVFDARLARRAEVMVTMIGDALDGERLGIVEHATAVLRESVRLENRRPLVVKLERLLASRGAPDLGGYATLQLVRRRLDIERPPAASVTDANGGAPRSEAVGGGRRIRTFESMGEEFALLLSLMVESSGAPPAALEREFARVLRCYTSAPLPLRRGDETGIVAELERAFETLRVQPLSIRRAFVQHCVEIVHADGHVAGAERRLLALFAASLGCEDLAA